MTDTEQANPFARCEGKETLHVSDDTELEVLNILFIHAAGRLPQAHRDALAALHARVELARNIRLAHALGFPAEKGLEAV